MKHFAFYGWRVCGLFLFHINDITFYDLVHKIVMVLNVPLNTKK